LKSIRDTRTPPTTGSDRCRAERGAEALRTWTVEGSGSSRNGGAICGPRRSMPAGKNGCRSGMIDQIEERAAATCALVSLVRRYRVGKIRPSQPHFPASKKIRPTRDLARVGPPPWPAATLVKDLRALCRIRLQASGLADLDVAGSFREPGKCGCSSIFPTRLAPYQ